MRSIQRVLSVVATLFLLAHAAGEVTPSNASNGIYGSGAANSVLVSEGTHADILGAIPVPHFEDLISSERGVRGAFTMMRPPLIGGILHVVSLVSKKQMVWVHTPRSVAIVQDIAVSRVFEMDLVRKSVSPNRGSILGLDMAVTIFGKGTSPKPTIIRFVNVIPEALGGRCAKFLTSPFVITLPAAVFALAAVMLPLRNGKRVIADRTFLFEAHSVEGLYSKTSV